VESLGISITQLESLLDMNTLRTGVHGDEALL
jgi:hypothetical protein